MKKIIPIILLGIILVPNIGCLTRDYNLRAIHDTDRNYVTSDSTDTLMKWRTESWSDDNASVWSSASVIITSMENVFGGDPSDHWIKEIKEDEINPFKGIILVDFDLEKINASWHGKNESDLLHKLYDLLEGYVMTYDEGGNVVNYTTGDAYVSLSFDDRAAYLSTAIGYLAEEIEDVRSEFGSSNLRIGVFFDYPNLAWQSYTEDPTTVGDADPFAIGGDFASYTTADMDSFQAYYDEVIEALDDNNIFIVVSGDRLDSNILSGSVIDLGEIDGVFIDDVNQSNYANVIDTVGDYRSYYPTPFYPTASLMVIAGVKENSYTTDGDGYATMIKALIDNGIYFTPGNDDGTSYFNYPRDNVMSWWRRVDNDIEWQTNPNVPNYESYTVHPTRIWGNAPGNVVLVADDSDGETVNGATIVSYSITSYDSTEVGGEWILGLDVEYSEIVDIYAKFGRNIQEAQADTAIQLSSGATTFSGTQSTGIPIPTSSYTDDLIVLLYSINAVDKTSATKQINYTAVRQLDIASIGNDVIDPHYWDVPTIDFTGDNVYYFDPSADTMGDGSRENPFQSLEAAIDSSLIAKYAINHTNANSATSIVDEGDVCVLLAGNHGSIHFDRYFFDDWIGIVADPYADAGTVLFDKMHLEAGEYFYIEGLTASGQNIASLGGAGVGDYDNPFYIKIEGDTSFLRNYVVIKDCDISYSTEDDVATWTATDWVDNVPNGINIKYRDGVLLQNNTMSVIGFALLGVVNQNIEVYGNEISNVCYDGIQIDRVDNIRIKSNQLYDFFDVSGNHNDAIQSFSSGEFAADPIDGLIVDSNTIIHKTTNRGNVSDQNSQLQLIANSTTEADRNMVNAIYMNNVLIGEDSRVGISLSASTSPIIANNTFVPHFGNSGPSILLTSTYGSTDVLIVNNVVTSITDDHDPDVSTQTTNFAFGSNPSQAMFTEWSNTMLPTAFNLTPLADSPLVDGGTVIDTISVVDINGDSRPRGNSYDIGAYETDHADSPEILTFTATSADSLEVNSTQYWAVDLNYVGDRFGDVEFTFDLNDVVSDPFILSNVSRVDDRRFRTTIPTTYEGTMNVGLTVTQENGLTATATRQIDVARYVDDIPPNTPTNLVVVGVGDQYVELEWYDQIIPDGYYNLYRSAPNDGAFSNYTVIPVDAIQQQSGYTDTGLINDSIYYYRVTAVDDWGNESSPTATVSGTPTAPVVPVDDPAVISFNILDAAHGGSDPDSLNGNWVLFVSIESNEDDVDGIITFNEIEQFQSTGGVPSQKDFPQMIESSIREITFNSGGYQDTLDTGVQLSATDTIWASAYFVDSGDNRTPGDGVGSYNVSVSVQRQEDPAPIFNSFTMDGDGEAHAPDSTGLNGDWSIYLDVSSNEIVSAIEARFALSEAGLSSADWQTIASDTSTYSGYVTTDVGLFEMGTLWAEARLTDAVDGDLITQNTSATVIREDQDITFTNFMLSNAHMGGEGNGNVVVDIDATLVGGSGTVEVRFSSTIVGVIPEITWEYPEEAQYTSSVGQTSISVDGIDTGIPWASAQRQCKITAIKTSGREYSDETYVDVTAPSIAFAPIGTTPDSTVGGNWQLESFFVAFSESESDIEYAAISFGQSIAEAMAVDPMDTLDTYVQTLTDYDTGVSIADSLTVGSQTIYPYLVVKNTAGLTNIYGGEGEGAIVLDRAADITAPTNSSFVISNADNTTNPGRWSVNVDVAYDELGIIEVKFADSEAGLLTATSQMLQGGDIISSFTSPPRVNTGIDEYSGELWASVEMVDIAGNSSAVVNDSMLVTLGTSSPPDGLEGDDATYYEQYIVDGPPIIFWDEGVGYDYTVEPSDSSLVYTDQDTAWYWNYDVSDVYTNERIHMLAKISADSSASGFDSVPWDTIGTNNIWNPGTTGLPVGGIRSSSDPTNAYVIYNNGITPTYYWVLSRTAVTNYLTSVSSDSAITFYVKFAVQDYDGGNIVESAGNPHAVTFNPPSLYTDYMEEYFASWNEVPPTLTAVADSSSYDSTNDAVRFNITSNNDVRLFYRYRTNGGEWATTVMTDTLSTNQWIVIPTSSNVNGDEVELGVKGRDIYYNTSDEIYDSVTVTK